MGSNAARSATIQRLVRAAVGLLTVASMVSACEYAYDESGGPGAAVSTAAVTATVPPDPTQEQAVTGEDLDAWAQAALPESQGQSFFASSGYVNAGESASGQTVSLPAGTYAVTMACRATRRVSFTVKAGDSTLLNLTLSCASARVSVVQVVKDGVLSITVASKFEANFAYRVSRL
ncbi:hypothetical protein [Arthrobacter sp. efr-133-TYG-104]|uniref:hypothetical protein n=1 Tax=Arthrobacter sp. efr-133-TYG-104 TaxID=3040324 RepID=UPI002549E4DF|nr:hypothetical protein [Arthrobacter sp. efr-133-TYG-104]